MSTLLYSHLTTQRQEAPEGTSTARAVDGAAPEAGKPGVSPFVDAMAALIPAEVLAVHAVLISLGTKTEEGADDKAVTTITEPGGLKALFIALLITSVILYVLGHIKTWGVWDWVRMLIPAAAFAAWTMLQKATMWDAWAPGMDELTRTGIGLIAALILGGVAYALAYKADAADPPA